MQPALTHDRRRRPPTHSTPVALLRILDGLLRTVENAAWEMRGIGARAVEHSRELCDVARNDGQRIADSWHELGNLGARAARVRSTGLMLAQLSASYRFHETKAAFLTQDGAAAALEALHARNAARFHATSCEQGGAFLKLGQMLSTRPDLLPKSWIEQMSKLQDDAPPVPFDEIRPIVEHDLGAPLDELFESFDPKPIAAASIGQVHRARTHDGVDVAVKVQRPDLENLIAMDLDLLELFLESVKSMLPPSDYDTINDEIRTMLEGELDYETEAETMNRVADFFDDHPRIVVPRAIPELTGPRVFASTFIEGRKITDALDAWHAQSQAGDAEAEAELADGMGLLLECYVRQVLHAGLFQADPHPGNLLFTDDGKLVLLDFGSTRALTAESRDAYLSLLRGFIGGDRDQVGRELRRLGFATLSGSDQTLQAFADSLLEAFHRAATSGPDFAWASEDEVIEQARALLELSHEDPVVKIPAEFVLLGRVFLSLGGLFQHYQPRLDYARSLGPVLAAL